MKKIVAACIGLIIISAIAFFSARYMDRWNDSEKTRSREAERHWSERVAGISKAPLALQNIDRLILQKKWRQARNDIIGLEKKNPELAPILRHREAEVLYRYGVDELSNLLFFIDNDMSEEMGEARDRATKAMNDANDIADSIVNSESKTITFSAADGAGDVNVRRAALAISKEERFGALSKAVEYYVTALMARDDYETKVKLELLIDPLKQSKAAGDSGNPKDLSPKSFQLVPMRRPGGGAAAGRHPEIPF